MGMEQGTDADASGSGVEQLAQDCVGLLSCFVCLLLTGHARAQSLDFDCSHALTSLGALRLLPPPPG